MAEERQSRRAADQGLITQTAWNAHLVGTTVWDWAEKRKVSAHIVMAVALWLTIRIVEWAIDLPYDLHGKYDGTHIAAMQAGVLGPWGLMQGAMFKFYYDLVRSNGGAK